MPQRASNSTHTAWVAGKDGASTQQILLTQQHIKLYLLLLLPGFICFELPLSKAEGGVKGSTRDWDTSLIILVCCWKFKQTLL